MVIELIGCAKPESKLKSKVILTDRKKKKVKRSKLEEKVSVVEGQKLKEQVVVQEKLGVKT